MAANWITAEEAQARLGVKLQTLYAYASRGLVSNRADHEDPRRSLYAADDIMRLSLRKSRGRRTAEDAAPLAWTEEPVSSGIALVADGRLFYRGRDAAELADNATFEEVARLLWGTGETDPFLGLAPHPIAATGADARARAFSLLAHRAANDPATSGRSDRALQREAAALLTDLVDAACGQARNGPLHDRLARAWRIDGGWKADLIRRALVLAAEQEMNASSLAVRVAASTGAPLAAAVLAGLATLSGPLHGGMTAQVAGFIAESRRALDARAAATQRLAQGLDVPGFGSTSFAGGDPRARALEAACRYADDLAEIARAGEAVTGAAPNFDFALVALCRTLGLPADAPNTLFLVGRTAGWLAHALEQRASGEQIRPKGAEHQDDRAA